MMALSDGNVALFQLLFPELIMINQSRHLGDKVDCCVTQQPRCWLIITHRKNMSIRRVVMGKTTEPLGRIDDFRGGGGEEGSGRRFPPPRARQRRYVPGSGIRSEAMRQRSIGPESARIIQDYPASFRIEHY